MEPTTILVILGAIFLFISLIGGGFKIKEIEMPHVNFLRRLMLFLFGLTLILAGFGLLPKIAQSLKTSFTETKVKTPLKTSKKPKIEIRSEKPEYTPPKPRVPEPTVYDPRSASITTDDKFLICRDIINRNPSGVSDRFDYGQVYV